MYSKKRRGNKRKRTNKKYQKKRIYGNTVNQTLLNTKSTGIPNRLFTTLKWVDDDPSYQKLYTAFSYANVPFIVNSLYIPDGTNQVATAYWTALSALYQYYRVHAVKVTVEFSNMQIANAAVVYLYFSNTALPINTAIGVNSIETAYSAYKTISGQDSGHSKCTLTKFVKMRNITGNKGYPIDDNTYGLTKFGGTASAPIDAVHMSVGVQNLNGINMSSNNGVFMFIKFKWYVEFWDRADTIV